MPESLPPQPRWYRTVRIAQSFLLQSNVQRLPVEPYVFYEKNDNWTLTSCGEILKYRKDDQVARQILEKDADAITFFDENTNFYCTIYNENFPEYRIRWTLSHEIGHIILGHFQYSETALLRGGLDELNNSVLEIEAHTFAAELLAPTFILIDLGFTNNDELTCRQIRDVCCISEEAATKRAKTISRYKFSLKHLLLRQQFRNAFSLFLKRVPVCTNKYDLWFPSNQKKYPKVKILTEKKNYVRIDENGRFLECPRCGNTEFSKKASYCKMCGLYLFNDCTRKAEIGYQDYCGVINSGDARYCEYCGSETVLLSQGLIKSWQEIIETEKQIASGLIPGGAPNLEKEEESYY